MDDLLQQGITAFKAGKQYEARNIFITVVKQSPDSESAWNWMYQASNNDQERIHCLKQIVRINPNNEKAKQKLDSLTGQNFPFESSQKVAPAIQKHNSVFSTKLILAFILIISLICAMMGIGVVYNFMTRETATLPTNVVMQPTAAILPPTANAAEPQSNEVLTYLLKIRPISDKLQALDEELGNEMIQFQNNHNLFYDQKWRSQINSTLDKMLIASNELESIEPVPQELRKFDSYTDQAASEHKKMVSNFRQYLNGDVEDTTYLLMAVENINNSNAYIDLATEEMKNFSSP